MSRTVVLLAAVTLSGLADPSLLAATGIPGEEKKSTEANAFVGLWRANVPRSQQDANHRFESVTLHFAVDGDTVTLTHEGINASGHEEAGVTTLRADGKEHTLPEAPGVVVVTRWVGPRVLDTMAMKEGQVAGRGRYELSADGKTLTATVSGVDAGGRDFEQVVVFDRE